ncbi:hypothetical protein NSQ55_12325 [Paenibacillus sp. FSL H7-0943]|uniref:hypothetical protein n=1 Tax=Paenibacillus sp. FSL H7-0943 TaxID=2954739 RepID=UPI0030CE3C2F
MFIHRLMLPIHVHLSSDATESSSSAVGYHRILFIRKSLPPNYDHPLWLSDSNDVIYKYIAFGARFRTPVQLFI